MTPLLELRNIGFSYPDGEPVLDGLDLKLHRGEKIGLRGRNGAGKTTLFHLIMGLVKPVSGEIFFRGEPVEGRKDLALLRKNIGFLFQDADDQLFCPTLLEDVAFGPLNLGLSPEKAMGRARSTLENLGLADLADRPPYALSGGQKKLGALATILTMEPEALILDEPTSGLDDEARSLLERILLRTGKTLLIASHDSAFLEKVAPGGYTFRDGKLFPVS